jgi:hypothetical protein
MAQVYSLTIRNRAAAIGFAVVILGLGAVFLTLGLALLAGLAVAGGVLGAGYGLIRRLRGGSSDPLASLGADRQNLDPSLEVQPTRPAIVASRQNDTE